MSVAVTFDYEEKKRNGILISDVLDEVREHFSVKSPKFGAARFNRYIPDRKYVITPGGRFKIGLYWEIYKYVRATYPSVEFTFTETFRKAVLVGFQNAVVDDRGLRDYQNEIVGKCLKMGTGTVVLATAGGKTFTMASLFLSINPLKGIIIVPDPGLVEQTYNDFLKYGIEPNRISRWTGEHELNKEVQLIIANRSILQSENSDTDWVKFVDMVIVDEVQSLKKDNGITDIVSKIHTVHKYGFTGTLPENEIDRWTIMGITGPIIFERKAHELREEKYVAESKALIIHVKYKTHMVIGDMDPNKRYQLEVEWLIKNDFRNRLITKICGNFTNNALLLVDRLEHGEVLKRYLEAAHPDRRVYFINGAMEQEDRENIKKLMEVETNILCIAMAKIFAVGISINNLHYIVFCNGGKARVRVIQSIGRGLRLHEHKQFLTIVDVADDTKYGSAHSEKRKLLYIEEKIPYTETSVSES